MTRVYQAVKAAYKSYGGFIKDIADKVGWETVLQVRKEVGRKNTDAAVHFIKNHNPETRMAEFGAISSAWYNQSGWVIDPKSTETEYTAIIHNCPIFDGFTEAELSVGEVNQLGKAVHKGMDERLKEDYPDAEFVSELKQILQ